MTQSLEAVFYQGDQKRKDHTPSSAVANGEVLDLGTICGICTTPGGIAADALGSLATTGTFKIKKAVSGGVTFADTALVYWDTANNTAVASSGSGIVKLGIANGAAADADDHVKTDLNEPVVQ